MSAAATNPFRATYRFLQRHSHENPAIVWALGLGFSGPLLVLTVPPLRRAYGWRPAERIPTTYPLPKRAREEVTGYDDEE